MIDFTNPPLYVAKRRGADFTQKPLVTQPKHRVSSLDDLYRMELPPLAHYPLPEPAVAVELPSVAVNEDGAAELSELLTLSLSKAKEILELPLTTDDDDFASILRAQVSSIQTVFNAQLRADEGRLRARALDMMPKILERMAQEEKKLLLLEGRGVLQ